MANKAKLTKKEYTRKRLFGAFVIFFAAVLIVTGVAVWLLFSMLGRQAEGNVNVSQVAMSPLSFSSLLIDGKEIDENGETDVAFIFDSMEDDDYGRVSWNGVSSEKMSFTVQGVITNATHLSSVTYSLALPEGVIEAAGKGYLDISNYYDMETGLMKVIELDLATDGQTLSDNSGNTVWRFSFVVEIKWGGKFNGLNPSIYYDDDPEGFAVPLEEVVATLQDLRETVNGSTEQPKLSKYTLTIIASPND